MTFRDKQVALSEGEVRHPAEQLVRVVGVTRSGPAVVVEPSPDLRGRDTIERPDPNAGRMRPASTDIVDDAVGVSFGASPGTNPIQIGVGAWKGRMVGMDIQTRKRVEGHAVMEIDDFARPNVDVALIGIVDADGRARADLRWENLPLVQGAFKSQHETASIEGRFYGSDHGEAGGIFERDRLIGAFGASR